MPAARTRPDLRHERDLVRRGAAPVAGVDEVGRGALAGPLYAAAVILPTDRRSLARTLRSVRDSKALTARQRHECAELVRSHALAWSVTFATADEVERFGPLRATVLAMRRAIAALPVTPRHVLIDHLRLPGLPIDQTPVTRGDARCLSVAAASILAKVARDRAMDALARDFPVYGFAHNKGYGTPAHLQALRRWGPCPIHRRNFEPVTTLARYQPGLFEIEDVPALGSELSA